MSQGQPSYKTNVNRAKTKRWVEAKSYSYDGDDWGEADEYDEYDGYEEPPPPPRPTGLRQRGQSASHGSEPPRPSPEVVRYPATDVKGPSLQQPQTGRNFTTPQPQIAQSRQRQNSFDQEDERRAFSGPQAPSPLGPSSGRQPMPPATQPAPPTSQGFQAIQHPDVPSSPVQIPSGLPYGSQPSAAAPSSSQGFPAAPIAQVPQNPIPPNANQGLQPMPFRRSPDEQGRYTGQTQAQGGPPWGPSLSSPGFPANTGGRTQSMASNNSSQDFPARRDLPSPATQASFQARGSPSPHGGENRHPPRKSSLGQESAPPATVAAQATLMASPTDSPASSRFPRERSGSATDKALPFVRPADIYRRMEEERERGRRSQDSSRPSMDSLMNKAKERPIIDTRQDSENGQRPKPTLDPVKERQSEYYPEGLGSNTQQNEKRISQAPSEKPPSQEHNTRRKSLQPSLKSVAEPSSPAPSDSFSDVADKKTTSKRFEIKKPSSTAASKSYLGPMLPEVSRVSGFGDSFGESFLGSPGGFGSFPAGQTAEATPENTEKEKSRNSQERRRSDLQHQPSLGFTSAVHQSFDNAQEQVPPTPSSTADSSVERSASGGTSAVSPIISRGPSTAMHGLQNTLPGIDDVASPEESSRKSFGERPGSSSTLGTPTQSKSAALPAALKVEETSPPPSFIPGHRRDMSTPSPDNSPARTPALEAKRPLKQPQEVELATTTPTPTDTDYSSDRNFKPLESETAQSAQRMSEVQEFKGDNQLAGEDVPAGVQDQVSTSLPQQGSPQQRSDSSENGRVRNLTDRFETRSRPESPLSVTTPSSAQVRETPATGGLPPPRPANDRVQSFRPQIPGGWTSTSSVMSSSKAIPQASSDTGAQSSKVETKVPIQQEVESDSPDKASNVGLAQAKEVSEKAFAAAATVGTALAGALVAAVGGDHVKAEENASDTRDAEGQSPALARSRSSSSSEKEEAATASYVHDFPKPLTLDNKAVSTASLPLPKDSPKTETKAYPDPNSDSRNDSQRLSQQQALPNISTNVREHEYESDRLRREIKKELGPSEPTTAESDSPYQASSKYSTTQSGTRSAVESAVLPHEYENYWDDKSDEDSVKGKFTESPATANLPGPREDPLRDKPDPSIESTDQSAQAPQTATSEVPQLLQKPHTLPHRFSWEAPLQELSPPSAPPQEPSFVEAPNRSGQEPAPTVQQGGLQEPSDYPETARSSTVVETSTLGLNDSIRKPPKLAEEAEESDKFLPESDAPFGPEKSLAPYANAPEAIRPDNQKETVGVPEPGPSSPFEDRGPPQQMDTKVAREAFLPQQSHVPPTPSKVKDQPSPNTVPSTQPKMPPFREILALKSSAERVKAYNDTRINFANLNTGLNQWLAVTAQTLPEHADLLSSQGRSATFQGHKASPSRSKLGGIIPSGSYQASTPDAMGSGASQPYMGTGGSGGKISSQQVQAKSKELLHSAGVFGGKANVAAKGLFSKGKNKFRGSGGLDKASPAAPRLGPDPALREVTSPSDTKNTSSRNNRSGPLIEENGTRSTPYAHTQESYGQTSDSLRESEGHAPSIESNNSQGRLGDDERSEVSAESTQDDQLEPQRPSDLDRRSPRPGQTAAPNVDRRSQGVTVDTSGRMRLGSNNPTPKQTHSPRSTMSSSNRTPTQTTFSHGGPESASQVRDGSAVTSAGPFNAENASSREPPRPAQPRQSSSTSFVSPPTSRFSNQDSSGQSNSSAPNPSLAPADKQLQSRSMRDRPSDRHYGRTDSGPHLEPPSLSPSPFVEDTIVTGLSPTRYSHLRGPSIGSIPSALDPERPPSPVSPQQPTPNPTQQRGRTIIPVHHGIDHDFTGEGSMERATRRSSSQQRQLQSSRLSEDSNADAPSIHNHPAFRQSSEAGRDLEDPVNFHPGLVSSGQNALVGTQVPQYQLERQGAPDLPPVDSRSQAQHGSRTSAFFRPLSNSPSRQNQPAVHRGPSNGSAVHQSSSTDEEKRNKRLSILGRFRGSSGTSSEQSRSKDRNVSRLGAAEPVEHPTRAVSESHKSVQKPISQPAQQPIQQPVRQQDQQKPSPGNKPSITSKFSKKLQRASTGAKPDQDDGKKNRLSSLGGLFSRSSQKRQTSGGSISNPQGQYISYNATKPAPSRFRLDEEDEEERNEPVVPPPEGYYAPGRMQFANARPQMPRQSNSSAYVQTTASHQPTQYTRPQIPRQSDTSAYVQTASQNQPTSRTGPTQAQPVTNTLPGASHQPASSSRRTQTQPDPNMSPQSNHSQQQSTPVRQMNTLRDEPASNQSERPVKSRSGGAWARFSSDNRSKGTSPLAAPPPQGMASVQHIKDFISAPPPSRNSRPTSRSWIEGTSPPPPHDRNRDVQASQEDSERSESPPPPPPPPKDDWHRPRGSHTRTASQPYAPTVDRLTVATNPADARHTMMEQRPFLPPLQTNVPSPTLRMTRMFASGSASGSGGGGASAASATRDDSYDDDDGGNTPRRRSKVDAVVPMSAEEKRRSRQDEIEKGHLSPKQSSRSAKSVKSVKSARSAKGKTASAGAGASASARGSRVIVPTTTTTTTITSTNTPTRTPTSAVSTSTQKKRHSGLEHKETVPPVREQDDLPSEQRKTGGAGGAKAETSSSDSDEPIVMSATSFPGQEWQPDFFHWEGD